MADETPQERSLPAKLGWFVALWCAGVLTVTVVAYGIRAMIL